jgi:hypothetical protein
MSARARTGVRGLSLIVDLRPSPAGEAVMSTRGTLAQ